MINKNYSPTEEVVLNNIFGRRVFVCNNELIKAFVSIRPPLHITKVRGKYTVKLYNSFAVYYKDRDPFLIETDIQPDKWKKEINSTEENTLLFLSYVDELYKKTTISN